MRRRLVLVGAAATAMVVLAFWVPLARLIGVSARERAVAAAERDAAAVAGAVSTSLDPDRIAAVIERTPAGASGRLLVVLPDGSGVGTRADVGEEVALAERSTAPFEVAVDGDRLWLAPVDTPDGTAVVRVVVPSTEATAGVTTARLGTALLALVLVGAGAVVADRLARSVTGAASDLAGAAARVAAGDLGTRVAPTGPPELVRVATSFNHLAERISELVTEEREAVADLSHRLRTPLTAMRLDAEAVADPDERERLLADVEALERTVDTVISDARRPERRTVTPVADLAAVAHERLALWSALAEEQGRAWRLDAPHHGVAVPVPPDDLSDAVDALLDNVFTHTPAGTAFSVSVSVAADEVRLVVSDDGEGFPDADVLARGVSTTGTTGLGLDIAARTARAAGGDIGLRNGPGAVVEIVLPLAP